MCCGWDEGVNRTHRRQITIACGVNQWWDEGVGHTEDRSQLLAEWTSDEMKEHRRQITIACGVNQWWDEGVGHTEDRSQLLAEWTSDEMKESTGHTEDRSQLLAEWTSDEMKESDTQKTDHNCLRSEPVMRWRSQPDTQKTDHNCLRSEPVMRWRSRTHRRQITICCFCGVNQWWDEGVGHTEDRSQLLAEWNSDEMKESDTQKTDHNCLRSETVMRWRSRTHRRQITIACGVNQWWDEGVGHTEDRSQLLAEWTSDEMKESDTQKTDHNCLRSEPVMRWRSRTHRRQITIANQGLTTNVTCLYCYSRWIRMKP